MRRVSWMGLTLVPLVLIAALVRADGEGSPKRDNTNAKDKNKNKAALKAPTDRVSPAHETAALAFVGQHYPELARLLERLKPMNRGEYEKAIGELYQVTETLDRLKKRDERRYDLALAAWKAKSRVEFLTAQMANAPSESLESQLREALEDQIDVDIQQKTLDRETLETRLRKTKETLEHLKNDRRKLIESRLQTLRKRSERARRARANRPKPRPKPEHADDRAKGETKP